MDNITTIDLFLMLVGSKGEHQANIDVLRSLYERTHSYYLAWLSALVVLLSSSIGVFAGLLNQGEASNDGPKVVIVIAFVVLLILIADRIKRLNRLQKNYLDIIQVYNLLARFF